jgi:hypothetical protein
MPTAVAYLIRKATTTTSSCNAFGILPGVH